MTKILLVEDDPSIAGLMQSQLARKGFEVIHQTVFHPISGVDLCILDVMLQGKKTGFEICHQLRQQFSDLPILILSALGDPSHRIEGLKWGADDYLAKPFEMEELLLRIQGMLRRKQVHQAGFQEFSWGSNYVHFLKYEAKRAGTLLRLTQKECLVLKLLIEKAGVTLSRDEILDKVWGYQAYPTHRTVDNIILKLRRYFEDDPAHPKHIVSVRGAGYRFIEGVL